MTIENVRPTRLELLRTRRRIVLARKGLKLLKLKRSALIAEFFTLSKEALQLRGDLQKRVALGYASIRRAEMDVGPTRLESISMLLPELARVSVGTKNVMGVKTPRVDSGAVQPPSEHDAARPAGLGRRVGPSLPGDLHDRARRGGEGERPAPPPPWRSRRRSGGRARSRTS